MHDSPNKPPMAMRELLWTERSVDQKLEALRELAIHTSQELHRCAEMLLELLRHKHMPDGDLVRTIDAGDNSLNIRRRAYIPMGLREKE